MALWHLIASGIESRVRGVITWLVRLGRRLSSRETATEAAEHVIHTMSMRDAEDRRLTHQIAEEQRAAIQYALQMTHPEYPVLIRDIPRAITYPANATGEYRYIVRVKYRDSTTGGTVESLHVIYSDTPLTSGEVTGQAEQLALMGRGNDTITGAVGRDVNYGSPSTVILSVTRRY
jgi:hypothetical protein